MKTEEEEKEQKKLDEKEKLVKEPVDMTPEELRDYNAKLREENARRRIKAKKSDEAFQKEKVSREAMDKELSDLKAKIEGYEKNEKEKLDKDKTELQKLSERLAQLEKDQTEKDGLIKEKENAILEKDQKLSMQDREIMIDRLADKLKINFSSDFERTGLMTEMNSRIKDGEFKYNADELVLKLKEFAKDHSKPLKTPGAGPTDRRTSGGFGEEIQSLLTKSRSKNLDDKDQKRLDELLDLAGEAADFGHGPPGS